MKNFSRVFLFLFVCAALVFGQTATTSTTTSAAMTVGQNTITLASGTGINVQGTVNQINTGIYVDHEFMWVTTLVSGTTYNVQRAKQSTRQVAHASGAKVLAGPLTSGPFRVTPNINGEVSGSCTATAEPYLPIIYTYSGHVYDCRSSGQWILIGTGTMGTEGQSVGAHCTGALTSGGTDYIGNTICATTSALVKQIVTTNGVLANLYVVAGAAVSGGSGKDVLTVQVNGTDSALTCTFATGGAATTCSDVTHSVSVKPGDAVTFKFVTASSDTGTDISARVSLF